MVGIWFGHLASDLRPNFLPAMEESWVEVLPYRRSGGKCHVMTSELFRRPVCERRVRSHTVVIHTPFSQHSTRLAKRREQRLIEALVAQSAIETLDERVLLGFAGLDIVPVYAAYGLSNRAPTQKKLYTPRPDSLA